MSRDRQEHNAPGGSRLSSNNPYRDLEVRGELESPRGSEAGFLTFATRDTPKVPRHPSTIRRKNTISAKPVPIEEFEAAFEERPTIQEHQDDSLSRTTPIPIHRRPSRADSIASTSLLNNQAPIPSYDAIEEADYSDTARLTTNMSGDSADHVASSPMRRNQSIRKVATVLRKVSRRVVNMQNDDHVPLVRERSSSTIPLMSKQQEEIEEESIPMTPTPSIKSAAPSQVDDPQHYPGKRKRRGILLVGRSCFIFGPESIIRRLFARILIWRYMKIDGVGYHNMC